MSGTWTVTVPSCPVAADRVDPRQLPGLAVLAEQMDLVPELRQRRGDAGVVDVAAGARAADSRGRSGRASAWRYLVALADVERPPDLPPARPGIRPRGARRRSMRRASTSIARRGEELRPVTRTLPLAPSDSALLRVPENLRECRRCDQLIGLDVSDCPYCGLRQPALDGILVSADRPVRAPAGGPASHSLSRPRPRRRARSPAAATTTEDDDADDRAGRRSSRRRPRARPARPASRAPRAGRPMTSGDVDLEDGTVTPPPESDSQPPGGARGLPGERHPSPARAPPRSSSRSSATRTRRPAASGSAGRARGCRRRSRRCCRRRRRRRFRHRRRSVGRTRPSRGGGRSCNLQP